ncbi:MAG: DUF1549 and DUF1553 domain-containing protein [Isosphaeraceae bacterium]|nr:DUF1549 and DUF1553 domain-containing protein [Isosphaeraceae bacterium]
MIYRFATIGIVLFLTAAPLPASGADMVRPLRDRFTPAEVEESPDFQRHVLPLMGRLGCNGRACHGSFQGRGGFRLSLFGYDFKTDHEALMKEGSGRIDLEGPEVSKVLQKPTLAIPHKGGKRMEEDTWQYRVLLRWIEGGAKNVDNPVPFEKLEVIPSEFEFKRPGETIPLQVIAHWADGTREDVTCISRFRTNDESIAEINEDGVVTCKGPGDAHVVAFYDNGVAVTQVILPVSDQVGSEYPEVPAPTAIDRLVLAKLRKLGVVPSAVCSDTEFLRRVTLDMTGSLPTPAEVEAFLADSSPGKREAKVDELLERPTYAAWWTSKLCDLAGVSPRNLNVGMGNFQNDMARHFYEWVFKRVKENMPYDKLVANIVLASSRKPGQSYEQFVEEQTSYYRKKDPADYASHDTMPYYWARRNLRTPDEKALGFSYTFLGVRLECAQCHKHPFDQWTQDDFKQFTAFFAPVAYGLPPDGRKFAQKMREDLKLDPKKLGGQLQRILTDMARDGKPIPWGEVYVNPNRTFNGAKGNQAKQAKGARVVTPKLLGAEEVTLAGVDDPRKPLMDWLRRKDNPYFARAFVNRVWAVYFGRGISNPPDDMNLANPPSNAPLLEYLADGFIAHEYDMKWLHREIVLSDTYQRTWHTNDTNRLDERNFSHALVRRIPAEALIDAVAQATARSADLAQAHDNIADRATGPVGSMLGARRGAGNYAAKIFGRSERETNCDCSTSNEPNLLQSIYMQNDQETLSAIERNTGWLNERAVAGRNKLAALQADSKAVDLLSVQAAAIERRIDALAKDQKQETQVATLKSQLKKTNKELSSRQTRVREAEKTAPAPFDPDQVIVEAYERTLGRRPADAEAKLAREYFGQAEDNAKGMRDLLWALLNTKEFITNH